MRTMSSMSSDGVVVIAARFDDRLLEEETERAGDDEQRIEARQRGAPGQEATDILDGLAEMDDFLRRARFDDAIAFDDCSVQDANDAAGRNDAIVLDERARDAK